MMSIQVRLCLSLTVVVVSGASSQVRRSECPAVIAQTTTGSSSNHPRARVDVITGGRLVIVTCGSEANLQHVRLLCIEGEWRPSDLSCGREWTTREKDAYKESRNAEEEQYKPKSRFEVQNEEYNVLEKGITQKGSVRRLEGYVHRLEHVVKNREHTQEDQENSVLSQEETGGRVVRRQRSPNTGKYEALRHRVMVQRKIRQGILAPSLDPSTPSVVRVHHGGDALLLCRVHNLGGFSVTWTRLRDGRVLAIDTTVMVRKHRLTPSFEEQTETWILRIKAARRTDASDYECKVSTTPPLRKVVTLWVVPEGQPLQQQQHHQANSGKVEDTHTYTQCTSMNFLLIKVDILLLQRASD